MKAVPNAEVVVRPLADGGEGAVEAMDKERAKENMVATVEQVFRLIQKLNKEV